MDAAVLWYRDVLGLSVLPPPYRMEGAMGAVGPAAGRGEGRDHGVPDDRVIDTRAADATVRPTRR
jgi:hypothetical protein